MTMKDKLTAWWDGRSSTFSRLTGESFTHGEVFATFVAVLVLLLACGLAEMLGG